MFLNWEEVPQMDYHTSDNTADPPHVFPGPPVPRRQRTLPR